MYVARTETKKVQCEYMAVMASGKTQQYGEHDRDTSFSPFQRSVIERARPVRPVDIVDIEACATLRFFLCLDQFHGFAWYSFRLAVRHSASFEMRGILSFIRDR